MVSVRKSLISSAETVQEFHHNHAKKGSEHSLAVFQYIFDVCAKLTHQWLPENISGQYSASKHAVHCIAVAIIAVYILPSWLLMLTLAATMWFNMPADSATQSTTGSS